MQIYRPTDMQTSIHPIVEKSVAKGGIPPIYATANRLADIQTNQRRHLGGLGGRRPPKEKEKKKKKKKRKKKRKKRKKREKKEKKERREL